MQQTGRFAPDAADLKAANSDVASVQDLASAGTLRDASGMAAPLGREAPLIDPFARRISYLRISVTDRCDFRCVYCMSEDMTFLPKREVLSLEELDRLCSAFVHLGVRKLRLTGGEPLVRRNIMWLIERLSRHLKTGALDELTLTTNGSQLARYADELVAAGVKRLNVSIDTLDPHKFAAITRWGRLDKVMSDLRGMLDDDDRFARHQAVLMLQRSGELDQQVDRLAL